MVRVPARGELDVLEADEVVAVVLRLVDDDLGVGHVEDLIVDAGPVGVVLAHRRIERLVVGADVERSVTRLLGLLEAVEADRRGLRRGDRGAVLREDERRGGHDRQGAQRHHQDDDRPGAAGLSGISGHHATSTMSS